MRKIILAAFVLCLGAASCTKESLTGNAITASSTDASHGADDGVSSTSGSGGGTRISASSVPTAVMNAYKAKFPGATMAEWKKLSNGTYKVQFVRNGVRWEAIFSASGTLLKLERA
jgi:hypothetical protein